MTENVLGSTLISVKLRYLCFSQYIGTAQALVLWQEMPVLIGTEYLRFHPHIYVFAIF